MEENQEVKQEIKQEVKKDNKNLIIGVAVVVIIILIAIIINLLGEEDNSKITISNTQSQTDSDISIEDDNNSNETENIVELKLKEKATKADTYELTVASSKFGKTILPPNTSGYYSYYEAKEEGHQYLEIKYNYKNLSGSNVMADDVVSMTIKYDDKYEYTGFCVIEDSDGDFTYSNITSIAPLTTGKLHYLFDVPDEVAKGKGTIVATIKCGNETYKVTIR